MKSLKPVLVTALVTGVAIVAVTIGPDTVVPAAEAGDRAGWPLMLEYTVGGTSFPQVHSVREVASHRFTAESWAHWQDEALTGRNAGNCIRRDGVDISEGDRSCQGELALIGKFDPMQSLGVSSVLRDGGPTGPVGPGAKERPTLTADEWAFVSALGVPPQHVSAYEATAWVTCIEAGYEDCGEESASQSVAEAHRALYHKPSRIPLRYERTINDTLVYSFAVTRAVFGDR